MSRKLAHILLKLRKTQAEKEAMARLLEIYVPHGVPIDLRWYMLTWPDLAKISLAIIGIMFSATACYTWIAHVHNSMAQTAPFPSSEGVRSVDEKHLEYVSRKQEKETSVESQSN